MAFVLPLFAQHGASALAGIPLVLGPVEQGSPAVMGDGLPQFRAVSASVTGPFLIAAQTSYTYGSIDGIQFGTTASTDGQCDPNAPYDCDSELLVEQLPSATIGLNYGLITRSDGISREIIGNVRPAGLIVSPPSLQGLPFLVGSSSDPWRIALTNTTAAAISVGKPSFIDVAGGATSFFTFADGCGGSLAPGATCVVGASFAPTTVIDVFGFVEIATSLGAVDLLFDIGGESSPANLTVDPQYINFDVGANGSSVVRTLQITNPASQGSESVTVESVGAPCDTSYEPYCLKIVANDCAKIPAAGSCEIKTQLVVSPTNDFTQPFQDYLYLDVSPTPYGQPSRISILYMGYPSPGPPNPAVIALSPATLEFPSTVFGQPSDPQTVTVTNVSSSTLTVALPSIANFIVDSSCTSLLPQQSCAALVRYVPTSGYPQTTGTLIANATDVADPTGLSAAESQQTIAVSGSSISEAALASPAFVIDPIDFNSTVSLNVTNTSAIPLIFGSIYGNLNYYQGEALRVDTTGCGASLAPGKTCTLVVNGHDCDEGVQEACILTVESNALSSPDIYPFEGTASADNHSHFSVDAGPIVFGHTPTGGVSAAQVVHVSLSNVVAPINVPFDVLPVSDPDFKIDNQCPTLLVPQPVSGSGYATACDILVTFAPLSPGFHVGALTFRSSLMGGSVVLAGTGSAPALNVTPLSLTFPVVGAGASSASQTVTVSNSGSAAIAISGISLLGGQADDYEIAKTCGASLAAAASCTITVTFKPVSAGAKRGSLSIADSAGGSPQSVALTGLGSTAGAAPNVQLSATALRFAKQAAGTNSVAQTVTLTNRGSLPLSLTSITVSGGQEADDYIVAKTCADSLAAGASCTLSVTFSPVSEGTKNASIALVDNASGSPQLVALTGTATASVPSVNLSVTSITFANQAVKTTSNAQSVILTNTGSNGLALDTITVAGGQADDYILTRTCGNSLGSGSSCSLSVTFSPVSAGQKNASITIADNARGSPQSIALRGEGTSAP